jgi:isopenicillin N synthase-like dioxygenase
MSDLARTLMRLFALALDQPETFFDDKIDKHISRLPVRNYPAPRISPQPRQLRAGAHSDYGSCTTSGEHWRSQFVRTQTQKGVIC